MRRLLFSLISLGAVAVVAIGATRAYFTDTEEIRGNSISTGTIHMTGTGSTLVPITISNLKPGDFNRKWVTFVNDGTLPIGFLSVNKENIVDTVGLLSQIEVATQCARSDDAGNMAFFTDSWGTLGPKPTIATWFSNSDILDGPAFFRTAAGVIDPGLSYTCAMDFTMPTTVGNAYQGQTATFDLIFTAEQVR